MAARKSATSWSEARQLAFDCAAPIPALPVPLAGTIGRTLAQAVTTSQDLPHYASSAMDGWAVSDSGPWTLVKPGQPLAPHHASPIATGGLVPVGTEAVLRRESGRTSDDIAGVPTLTLGSEARPGEPRSGQHIRHAGEEACAGEVLIPAGTVLNPAHIALAAIAGHDELHVFGKPRVAILLTGSEVVTSGLPAPGQVRDVFGPQLGTVLAMLGGAPVGQRRIGDSYQEWLAALSDTGTRPAERPDVVITTGGTGRSGTDHFRNAIAALGGRLLLDGIAMRPGHPAVLAELPDGRFVVGLPGNPLAAMMALITIGAPLIAALGHCPLSNLSRVTSGTAFGADPGRTRLLPFRFDNGLASPAHHTGPGMMRGLAWADGVLAVPPHGAQPGDPVPALPLPWTQTLTAGSAGSHLFNAPVVPV
ncbi:molybdopterin molybdotransferase MoeA [Arthrobacter sp. 2MCAF14]